MLHHNPVVNPLNTTDVHLKPSHVYKAMAYFGLDHLSIWLTWVQHILTNVLILVIARDCFISPVLLLKHLPQMIIVDLLFTRRLSVMHMFIIIMQKSYRCYFPSNAIQSPFCRSSCLQMERKYKLIRFLSNYNEFLKEISGYLNGVNGGRTAILRAPLLQGQLL